MPSQMKFGLLALVGSAAAIPHYGHSRYHKPSGAYGTGNPAPYPTGGWEVPKNSTAVPYPTGTGAVSEDEPTTTLVQTVYSTATIVETIYASKPGSNNNNGGEAPSSVGAADVSTGAAQCGPATVYVTATNQVTVTVSAGGAGGAGSPSSVKTPASSAAEVVSSKAPVYEEAPPASKPVEEEKKYSSVSIPQKEATNPKPTEDVYSILPVTSEAAVPTSQAAPVSSASPASSAAVVKPSGSPSYNGGKRGLAYNKAELCSAFNGGNIGWAWNWAPQPDGDLPEGVSFVPTCGKYANHNTAETKKAWFDAVDKAVKSGTKAVQGFNEPDHWEQDNQTPAEACASWKELMNPIAESYPDLTILGPSVTNGQTRPEGVPGAGSPMGLNWLDGFQSQCKDAVYHATNIHFYDIVSAETLDRFKSQIETAVKNYGKPVWVTEFGLRDGTPEDAANFLKEALPYLDGNSDVQGYSWFMVGDEKPLDLNVAGGLSAPGKVYASL